jgi:hypothetical protein
MSDEYGKLKVSRELNETLGIELIKSIKQLREDLIEDALKIPRGTSFMTKKIKSSKLLPLLVEYEATMRTTRDELRLEREKADELAEILRGTSRALLDAPSESMQMVLWRLPPTLGAVLTQRVSAVQGEEINMETVFDEPEIIMSKGKLRKRKRIVTSDDEGEGT